LPEGAAYCPSCGASTTTYASYGTSLGSQQTEFDRITKDSKTQEHWVRRVIAYIIDLIIVDIVSFIIALIGLVALGIFGLVSAFNPFAFLVPLNPFASAWIVLTGLLFIGYFTILEWKYHKTVGKSLLGLLVITTDGSKVTLEKALIRNVSKIYWLLLLLDVMGGLLTEAKPGQKFSDKIAGTTVIHSGKPFSGFSS
jgi:uncharacterized RDD family membrane protein YckC